MSRLIKLAIWTIVAHAIVSFLHGAAHQNLGVTLTILQTLFVAIVISIAPLLAGVVFWKGSPKIGALILVGSMIGALIFGVYNHFVAISPDHVSHLENTTDTIWILIFRSTAVLIAIIEAIGIWIGVRLLKVTRPIS